MTWDHPRGHGALVAASDQYQRLYGVQVTWEARSLQEFGDAPIYGLAEAFDLLVIDHPHVPAVATSGILAPLDVPAHAAELSVLAENSVGASHRSYTYAGRQWALAIDAAAQVAAHRPDLLDAVPTGWPEVFDLAREGRVLWAGKTIDAYSSLVTIAANAGTPPMTTPGEFLDAPSLAAALDILHRLADAVPHACLQMNPIDVAEQLVADDGDYVYCPLLFGYTNYSRAGFRRRRLRYTDIPSGRQGVAGSLLGGAGIAVSATATDVDAARAFAYWAASASPQRGSYFDGGGQPGHAAAWADPRLDDATLNFFSGTRQTMEAAYVRPQHPRYLEFQNAAAPLVSDLLAGDLADHAFIGQINTLAARLLSAVPEPEVPVSHGQR
jgi:multiple sugar transport system substrate-binding protein